MTGIAAADVHWGQHEPQPGKFTFKDNLDLAAYLQLAAEQGLHVLLRPGPYICAEQSFGGLPWWLGSPQVHPTAFTCDACVQMPPKRHSITLARSELACCCM